MISCTTAWQRIAKAAGLEDIRIHDLRHTMGTYAGAAGFNAFLVKQLLGHKTLAMTDAYVGKHVDPLQELTRAGWRTNQCRHEGQ